jgi:hypothetical protein
MQAVTDLFLDGHLDAAADTFLDTYGFPEADIDTRSTPSKSGPTATPNPTKVPAHRIPELRRLF